MNSTPGSVPRTNIVRGILLSSILPLAVIAAPAASAPQRSATALPPDARALVEKLPGKALGVEFVLKTAIETSDSYKVVASLAAGEAATGLQAQAPYQWRLLARAATQDDRREPVSPFSPSEIEGTLYAIGAQKFFSTGTSLSVDLQHGPNRLAFANPQIQPIEYVDTRATVGITQKLLKDALGGGTRAGTRALEAQARAVGEQALESREEWALGLAQLFYASWLSQAQLFAADASLERRERLLDTTRLLVKRGTSERPDLLQAEAALNTARVDRSAAELAIGNRWRELLTALKLPTEWASIDTRLIPLELDDSPLRASNRCFAADGAIQEPPTESSSVRRAKLQAEAARASLDRASSQLLPDLELGLQAGANGIDSRASASVEDFTAFKYPFYQVGLTLTLPIGFDAERSSRIQAGADLVRADAAASQSMDDHRTQWRNRCLDLSRLREARSLHADSFARQKERVKLEEERFRIGRSSVFQVIQAGDELTRAEALLNAIEMELRMTSWRILRQGGELEKPLAIDLAQLK